MDFDTFINLIILFLFLALPSLLKRRKTKKAKQGQAAEKSREKKKRTGLFSLFGKISARLQQFREELERQAQLQQQRSGKSVWDDLAEPLPEEPRQDQDLPEPEFRAAPWDSGEDDADFSATKEIAPEKPEMPREPRPVRKRRGSFSEPCMRPARRVTPCRLRQALIWSEILGKPIALREGDGPFRN